MIHGVGNDIVEIARIEALFKRYPQRFLKRIYTPFEREYCLKKKFPSSHLAARFAAKEAIVKALGTGFSNGLNWLDIEVRNDPLGKPIATLSPYAKALFGDCHIHISMSHSRDYATAIAICIGKRT